MPRRVKELAYPKWEADRYWDGEAPPAPWMHEVRVRDLRSGASYRYRVQQGEEVFEASFATPPGGRKAVRFIVYADSETEPESDGKPARWPGGRDPAGERVYLVDQTEGYAGNLAVIRSRGPAFVVIAGDLVQSGGEQRDWDEFWRHNAGRDGAESLAGNVPLVPALGNHEYYAGPKLGGYNQPHSERAVARYLAYFGRRRGEASHEGEGGRFYRFDYGPVRLFVLDTNNGRPHGSKADTNFYLKGHGEEGGGGAPPFHPGSPQYKWLRRELRKAQREVAFTFVVMHQAPYSSGPHGKKPGPYGEGDPLSGQPVRILTPLFVRRGVDAVFSGHDEMYERSTVQGEEVLPGDRARPHTVHFYDVGIGGDGLRAPDPGAKNPRRQFLAHADSPEVWDGETLIQGGKHYGHLEVNVEPEEGGGWKATLVPVYVLPRKANADVSFERTVYADRILLHSGDREKAGY